MELEGNARPSIGMMFAVPDPSLNPSYCLLVETTCCKCEFTRAA